MLEAIRWLHEALDRPGVKLASWSFFASSVAVGVSFLSYTTHDDRAKSTAAFGDGEGKWAEKHDVVFANSYSR